MGEILPGKKLQGLGTADEGIGFLEEQPKSGQLPERTNLTVLQQKLAI